MRKLIPLLVLTSLLYHTAAAQSTLQQKLYYTGKVWGFVRYFHSNVSTCHVNWDSVLVAVLPKIISSANDSEFNNELDTMLIAAGPMALSTTYFPDTLAPELKRNRNFSWIATPTLRTDVQTILDTIKNNFRPHAGCYVEVNPSFSASFGGYGGYLLFPQDMPLLPIYTVDIYPNEEQRLLLLFKFWNIINYFNPYNYVLDKPADSILYNNIPLMDTASNANVLYNSIRKITSALDDAHVEGLTYSVPITYPSEYVPQLMLRYIQGQYVVVKSGISTVPIGSVITGVNGRTTAQIEDSLSSYISAGNISVLRRTVCQYLLWGPNGSSVTVTYTDPTGTVTTVALTRTTTFENASFFPEVYYPADSISNIRWTTMECGIGYVNTANFSYAAADSAYNDLYNAPAIIVDLRSGTSTDGGTDELAYDMSSIAEPIDKGLSPDATYPGTYIPILDTINNPGNPTPYHGTIIILFNEETQSHCEAYAMEFSGVYGARIIKIGSQTAGADGVISYFLLTSDIHTGFTCYGFSYPNGDSTQRIGIVPDTVAAPTIAGIIAGRDEVLEKALNTACGLLLVPQVNASNAGISLFPNPATNTITVQTNGLNVHDYTIMDITGRILLQQENNNHATATELNLQDFSPGIYLLKINTDSGVFVRKFSKE